MKKTSFILFFLFAALLRICAGGIDGFSFSNKPFPKQFTDTEKEAQINAGKQLKTQIMNAFNSGESQFVIPPGDYRFVNNDSNIQFENMNRPESNPFLIIADDVTFWLIPNGLPAPSLNYGLTFTNCSHIGIRGLTLDNDPRNATEGEIKEIDYANEKVKLKLSEGYKLPARIGGDAGRFLPFKSDGRFATALYHLWYAGGNLVIEGFDDTLDADSCFWVKLPSVVFSTMNNSNWIAAYGGDGVLEVGDGIHIIGGVSATVRVMNCKEMLFDGLKVYTPKGNPNEYGGYGNHKWINCKFTRRPNSNQLQGADGWMIGYMRNGSTYDNMEIAYTADDVFNFFGRGIRVTAVSGNTITLDENPGILPGDMLEFYTGYTFSEKAKASTVSGKIITVENASSKIKVGQNVNLPDVQNSGWVIKNSYIHDSFQRGYIQCGRGTIDNTRFERIGSLITIFPSLGVSFREEGVPHDMIISNCVFTDVCIRPDEPVISFRSVKGVAFTGNVINNTSNTPVLFTGCEDVVVSGNKFVNPYIYGHKYDAGQSKTSWQAIRMTGTSNGYVSKNTVIDELSITQPGSTTGTNTIGYTASCSNIQIDDDKKAFINAGFEADAKETDEITGWETSGNTSTVKNDKAQGYCLSFNGNGTAEQNAGLFQPRLYTCCFEAKRTAASGKLTLTISHKGSVIASKEWTCSENWNVYELEDIYIPGEISVQLSGNDVKIDNVNIAPQENKKDNEQFVTNFSFEIDGKKVHQPTGWTIGAKTENMLYNAFTADGGTAGEFCLKHDGNSPYRVKTEQRVIVSEQGLYRLKADVRSSGGQNKAYMYAKYYGGSKRQANIAVSQEWTEIEIDNIQIQNGYCTVGFYSDASAGQWLEIDNVRLEFNNEGAGGIAEGNYYEIRNLRSGKSLSIGQDAYIRQKTYQSNDTGMEWGFESRGDKYVIKNKMNGLYLTNNSSAGQTSRIQTGTLQESNSAFLWELKTNNAGCYYFVNEHSGYAMDILGSTDDSQIFQRALVTDSPDQLWIATPVQPADPNVGTEDEELLFELSDKIIYIPIETSIINPAGKTSADIKVYPVPFDDELFVELNSDYGQSCVISLYTLAGQKLGASSVYLDCNRIIPLSNYLTNLSSLATGIYILDIRLDSGSYQAKIMKK